MTPRDDPGDASARHPEADVNRLYFLGYVRNLAPGGATVLDYGCGSGEMVAMLRNAGYNAYGCDIRWPGADYGFSEELPPGTLRYFEAGGRLPFDDDRFDVVISDQVFEHVVPIQESVAEIERVTKPGGVMYHHFPTRDVWREGHIGIPFSHRMRRGRLRLCYTTLLRRMGVGIYKDERPATTWAREKLQWIDEWTAYRPAADIPAIFGRNAAIRHREIEYCRFRVGSRAWLRAPLSVRVLTPLNEWLFRHLAFVAIECRLRRHGDAENVDATGA